MTRRANAVDYYFSSIRAKVLGRLSRRGWWAALHAGQITVTSCYEEARGARPLAASTAALALGFGPGDREPLILRRRSCVRGRLV